MRKIVIILAVFFLYVSLVGISCREEGHPEEPHRGEEHGVAEKQSEHKDENEKHSETCDHDSEDKDNDHEKEGHDDDNEDYESENDHDERDHSKHEGEDEEDVRLSKKAIALAGIESAVVEKKAIAQTIELSGEIGYNEDRLAHITPRFSGVVKEIHKQLGRYVEKGERLATIESNASLTNYAVRSPIAGWIVEKHATPGEFAGEETTLFVVANLGSVWANCEVFAKDVDVVGRRQPILIKAVGSDRQIQATLSYVAHVYNETTRSIIARAVIPNKGSAWRPGTFITGVISLASDTLVPAVNKDAIQILHDETVVFVPEENNVFKAVEVKTGLADDQVVEIVSGLKPGDTYVAKGAFEIKAKIVTSALGDHAGHGH